MVQKNCPNGDDEMFCLLMNHICPSACQCLILAVKCIGLSLIHDVFFAFHLFVSIDISRSTLSVEFIIDEWKSTQIIKLSKNNIKEACLFNASNVLYLDLSFNLVRSHYEKLFHIL